jgi:hypothetical protein
MILNNTVDRLPRKISPLFNTERDDLVLKMECRPSFLLCVWSLVAALYFNSVGSKIRRLGLL